MLGWTPGIVSNYQVKQQDLGLGGLANRGGPGLVYRVDGVSLSDLLCPFVSLTSTVELGDEEFFGHPKIVP